MRQWIEEKDTLDELIHVCLKAGKKFGISDISAAAHKLARLAARGGGWRDGTWEKRRKRTDHGRVVLLLYAGWLQGRQLFWLGQLS